MPNALSSLGSGPPPAPNPRPMQSSAGGSALAPNNSPNNSPNAQPQQVPAPSHQQTVAALRHFDAIERELRGLLADPDLGKTDMRSQIQDGAVKLVAGGIMTAAQAVAQLTTVPDRPSDQRKWVEQHFQQVIQSADLVLDHHRAAFAGQPAPAQVAGPDQHADVMSGLLQHYQGLKANG